jgi:hypothetical protein
MGFCLLSSSNSFLGWGVQNPNSEPALSILYTMRHYVLASCRTWRKPGSESFLRIHSTCKKWHLKQSKRLNDNHLQAFTWQLSQVTCWDFLGWTRWQVQGKEINQNNTSSHQTFAPMTPNDNGPNRRDTKMRTEMSGTDSGQDSGAKPWRYPWTPLQWAPRQPKPASNWKLTSGKFLNARQYVMRHAMWLNVKCDIGHMDMMDRLCVNDLVWWFMCPSPYMNWWIIAWRKNQWAPNTYKDQTARPRNWTIQRRFWTLSQGPPPASLLKPQQSRHPTNQ